MAGQSLKDKAQANPTQLGDHVSLKAETSNSHPTPDDTGAKKVHKSLKQVAQETNPSQLGDPISLKAETSDTEPTPDDRGARGSSKKSKL
ncbi:uncharacterized protein K489DRAFT_406936 [Dissoconium aciculare CBS 342.82]|uniref:Uncharacterized protein n=1 Tax=Dissoconium aciculare CBS 342.82 TaxID=1314786 RepID=A0A6J3MGX7_9PEZI|nr:uncharacterized protein K489DRAFT_406936 [Dissoconium aciculare CBS 342.82]KAF1826152.1 hypothetical protein K489DRAFT_406936 [Dissoconium aciculare CBS 342.82]